MGFGEDGEGPLDLGDGHVPVVVVVHPRHRLAQLRRKPGEHDLVLFFFPGIASTLTFFFSGLNVDLDSQVIVSLECGRGSGFKNMSFIRKPLISNF